VNGMASGGKRRVHREQEVHSIAGEMKENTVANDCVKEQFVLQGSQ